ncbi:phosphatase PAP2 family protein [Aquisediminimonas sediminicola]|uniref:phosphatase PAP2 family protein n=1 Tax=Alteraquisediminimonas sediminicola TaxID=2676787 RepID=UPI001C8D98E4|nr:phosphatase PAP2 family protein [Aquisediminimonas sediminicola]
MHILPKSVPMALAALCLIAAPAWAVSHQDWDTASSIGAYGLTAIAIGWPLLEHDRAGALQAVASGGAAELVAQGLKATIHETRPDGSNRRSFPSGHTSVAFAAAASLYERQGPQAGVAAFTIASLVGVARVKADKHHWYDCVAGAAIGISSGLLITHKPNRNVAIVPYMDSKGGGLSLAMRF